MFQGSAHFKHTTSDTLLLLALFKQLPLPATCHHTSICLRICPKLDLVSLLMLAARLLLLNQEPHMVA